MNSNESAQPMPAFAEAFSLHGQTAIVAGAGSVGEGIGIGRASAILFAAAGARVGLIDTNADAAAETLELIEAQGGEAVVATADVSDVHEVSQAVMTIARQLGPARVLLNNVGIVGPGGTVEVTDLKRWDDALRTNITSMVMTSRFVIPQMRKLGGGSIINMSSIAGLGGGYPHTFYPTSKGAIVSLTKAMAAHHGFEGIRVNAVAPGQLLTPRISSRGVTDEMRQERTRISMLGTEGNGWDAGYAVLYLASGAARWVTGIVLPVDAGVTSYLRLQSPAEP
jgi:NAD(P)-dependent dehydrogenase (short-subunit alcohol dehydrogenase family)